MPIYEYSCYNCNIRFEKIQKISDPDITICPECNQNSIKKLISAAGFRLKGSGWYETDFKSSKEIKRNLAVTEDVNNSGSMDTHNDLSSSKNNTVTGDV
jgi:putative FmdB family regulatory protein